MKKIEMIFMIVMLSIIISACGAQSKIDKSPDNNDESPIAVEEKEIEENEDVNEDGETLYILKGKDFSDDVALILRLDESGNQIVSVIDEKGNIIFNMPQLDDDIYFDGLSSFYDGHIKWEDVFLDKNGNITFRWEEKYNTLYDIGNEYYLVKVNPEGYQQQSILCGIIDGYGNEVIPVSEELAHIVAPNGDLNFSRISYKEKGILAINNAIVDANERMITYLEGYNANGNGSSAFLGKRKDIIVTIWGQIYNLDGSLRTTLDIERSTELIVSDNVIFNFSHNRAINGTTVNIFDFQSNLIVKKELQNCVMNSVTASENGKCAFYIDGSDGFYATMMDENGEFLFEPVKCYDATCQQFTEISDGLLKISCDAKTTKFINDKGECVVTVNVNCRNVGDCVNGYILVDDGGQCYYVDSNGNKL